MLYLLDANVLITAHNRYYPIESVPEFWSWLLHQAENGQIKMPIEMIEEVAAGKKDKDSLVNWISNADNKATLLLDEDVDQHLVQEVLSEGYASDLTDVEIEELTFDPFLIAYALAQIDDRCVVTVEVSKPGKKKKNRKIPDVCNDLGIYWCDPFELNRALGFKTSWNAE